MKKVLHLFLVNLLLIGSVSAQTYMYGTTSEGGANNLGTIYRIDENGQNFEKLFDFTTSTGGTPLSGLTLGDNGKLYGFTTTGGQLANPGAATAFGSFYEFDPLTNSLTIIEYIDDQSIIGNGISHSPTLGNDGLLYFTSPTLGLGGLEGVLSLYDPSTSIISVLDTFTSYYGQPKSKLLEASDGDLYITTNNFGEFGHGAVVKYDKALDSLVRIHSSPGSTGNYDNAVNNPLFEAANGWLYGTSQGGGAFNLGTVFMIAKDGTGYWQIDVMSAGITDEGYYPEGGFIEHNGILYSSTPQEESVDVNSGTLYTVNTVGDQQSFIHTLDLEGSRPRGTFTKSSNGRFYLTCEGGMLNSGSIIEYNPLNGNVIQRHVFNTIDGIKPEYDELCVVDFSALSIDESSLLDNIVKTYPNPFQDIVNIKIEESHLIETIKILDMKGSELYIDNSKSNESNVNTSFLSSGVYLLYIQTDLGSTTRKIIKE